MCDEEALYCFLSGFLPDTLIYGVYGFLALSPFIVIYILGFMLPSGKRVAANGTLTILPGIEEDEDDNDDEDDDEGEGEDEPQIAPAPRAPAAGKPMRRAKSLSGLPEVDVEQFAGAFFAKRHEMPHMLIDGNSGAGKTRFARTLCQYLPPDEKLIVVNPNHKAGEWGDNVITVDGDGQYSQIDALFRWLVAELARRGAELATSPDTLVPLTLVWDELPETMEESNAAKEFLRRVARRGRQVKMYVIALVQLSTAGEMNLKGRAALKRGFLNVKLGETARQYAPAAFSAQQEYPALVEMAGTFLTVDRDVPDAETFDAETFYRPDLAAVAGASVLWSELHVRTAILAAQQRIDNLTFLTKTLYPQSGGTGQYREKARKILQEVAPLLKELDTQPED